MADLLRVKEVLKFMAGRFLRECQFLNSCIVLDAHDVLVGMVF